VRDKQVDKHERREKTTRKGDGRQENTKTKWEVVVRDNKVNRRQKVSQIAYIHSYGTLKIYQTARCGSTFINKEYSLIVSLPQI
jgi:hypothetical protein